MTWDFGGYCRSPILLCVIKHGTPMNRVDFQEPRAPDEQWAAKVQSPTIFEGLGIYLKVEVPKHHEITLGCFM